MSLNYSVHNGYKIQIAKEADIPFLDAVEAVAGTIFPLGSVPENVLSERVHRDVFVESILKNRLLVIVDSIERPVGFAFWQEVSSCALLALIEVDPQHGQQGLGTALVLQIIDQVDQAGFQHLYLTTFSSVPWNAPFYQTVGFTILSDQDQPEFIKEILQEERAKGLNNRIAMRYSIQAQ